MDKKSFIVSTHLHIEHIETYGELYVEEKLHFQPKSKYVDA